MTTLDARIASNLRLALAPLSIGDDIPDSDHRSIALSHLERYVPAVLAEIYPEWKHESLDGFIPLYMRKCHDHEMELFGLCWIITDQSRTPILLRVQTHRHSDEIAYFQCKLGERGESGMLRTKSKSKAQLGRMHDLVGREDSIDWVYKAQLGCRINEALIQKIMQTIVKDDYLKLHREIYLQPDQNFNKSTLQDWLDQLTESDVEQLLCAGDWRPKLVGIYCVLYGRTTSLVDRLKEILLSRNQLLSKPVCLALTLLNDKASVQLLVDFLKQPIDPDLLDAYAAALAGIKSLGVPNWERYRREIIRQFRGQEFFEEQMLREFEAQFERALDFWK